MPVYVCVSDVESRHFHPGIIEQLTNSIHLLPYLTFPLPFQISTFLFFIQTSNAQVKRHLVRRAGVSIRDTRPIAGYENFFLHKSCYEPGVISQNYKEKYEDAFEFAPEYIRAASRFVGNLNSIYPEQDKIEPHTAEASCVQDWIYKRFPT